MPTHPVTLASDLGGTPMKIGVVRDGQVLAQTRIPAHSKTAPPSSPPNGCCRNNFPNRNEKTELR